VALVTTNFHRRVHCILGLPFDALSVEEAEAALIDSVRAERRCFFSTPNLNFLISCLHDAPFRDSVIHSDLSLADGMPVVWMARILGIPVRTRVAGSTLFERLRGQDAQPIKVFFFGGPTGVADQAARVINNERNAMCCVGSYSPGFGTIDEMSSRAVIDEINRAKPDFLLVALGAKRGQAWIERNLGALHAPVISHLGAVINFVAGTVSRAPPWVGGMGLEWLWRIKEEPALWRRYMRDGLALGSLLVNRVIPCAIKSNHVRRSQSLESTSEISVFAEANRYRITLSGRWYEKDLLPLREACQEITVSQHHIQMDMSRVTALDNACVGLLMLIYGHQLKNNLKFNITEKSLTVSRFLYMNCASYLIDARFSSEANID
jgi:N-acetylglucosaminyldiphosphoundecaprenol N-acetyl-beta-D-mannosaminyltransferase